MKDDALIEAVEQDWNAAPLTEARRAMLTYAVKLTRTPGDMTAGDVDDLKSAGFTDRDVLDIAEVTAYYAYVNRIADGLGVQTESWIPDD